MTDGGSAFGEQAPAPWTELAVRRGQGGDVAVTCWGRTCTFGRQSFLRQVRSAGKPMLAAPVRLTGRADGQPLRWRSAPVELREQSPGCVRLARAASNAMF